MPDTEERLAVLRLIRSQEIGPATFYQLVEQYGSAGRALDAVPGLARRGGGKQPIQLCSRETAETELAACEALGARIITLWDEEYPAMLRHISDAPPVLTLLGNAALFARPAVAMVGARNASLPGCRLAGKLAQGMAEAGYAVVSGLARGIDAAVHKGAGARNTIAVVAGGIDHIYPRENTELYHAIACEGAVVTECAFGTVPKPEHFPRRNRIISGLARGTVVVEANARSGSLITARFALEQGREVMAVPGFPLDPRAEGPNKLLKEGAALVETPEDILNAVNQPREKDPGALLESMPPSFAAVPPALDEAEVADVRERLAAQLSFTPVAVDALIAEHGGQAEARAVLAALLELELAGRLTRHPGNRVSKA